VFQNPRSKYLLVTISYSLHTNNNSFSNIIVTERKYCKTVRWNGWKW